jgi:hypothetical protein
MRSRSRPRRCWGKPWPTPRRFLASLPDRPAFSLSGSTSSRLRACPSGLRDLYFDRRPAPVGPQAAVDRDGQRARLGPALGERCPDRGRRVRRGSRPGDRRRPPSWGTISRSRSGRRGRAPPRISNSAPDPACGSPRRRASGGVRALVGCARSSAPNYSRPAAPQKQLLTAPTHSGLHTIRSAGGLREPP